MCPILFTKPNEIFFFSLAMYNDSDTLTITGIINKYSIPNTVKPVHKDHLRDQQNMVLTCRWSLLTIHVQLQ